jgi:hypothetical protein
MKRYRHVQFSWRGFFIIVPISLFVMTSILANEIRWVILIPFLLIATALVNFLWLTIEVDQEAVKVRFGPGLIRFTFPLQEIENVCIDQSSWSEFWGIRFTARGLILNISGMDAVELDFKNGGMIRVGTNEPEQLAKAIEDELIARKRQEHHRVI